MSEATPEAVLQVYLSAIDNLKDAQELLQTPYSNFMVESAKLLVSPEFPLDLRLKLGILFKFAVT